MTRKNHYGLFTTITMIVGIVIGSGIFFKADNILIATGGSVTLGILVFAIAAFSIIFGCLTLSNFASLTDNPGGAFAYIEEFVSKKLACAFGWFQIFIYYPTITVVVSWAVGIFMADLFGMNAGLEMQILLGFSWFFVCYFLNILSAKLGGIMQNISTILKMIPLITIGILGFLLGNPADILLQPAQEMQSNLSWFNAIGPIAFSFDGWIIATVIAFEVKNAKRNLPRALIMAPLFILLLYLLYFAGMSSVAGVDTILQMQDASVGIVAQNLFGVLGAKAIMVFVVISVMGTVNGVILGYIRLPYSLALKNMLPHSSWLAKINEKSDMPINSGIFSIAVCLFWWVIHYFTMKYNVLNNSDVSEIAIVMSYLLYTVLYFKVFTMYREGKIKSILKGVIFPSLATLGSLFILFGGIQNPNFMIFVVVCLISLVAGYFYYHKKVQI